MLGLGVFGWVALMAIAVIAPLWWYFRNKK